MLVGINYISKMQECSRDTQHENPAKHDHKGFILHIYPSLLPYIKEIEPMAIKKDITIITII